MIEPTEQSDQQQALEPVEQETVEFHGEQIIAVKLADSRICVVLRWVCASLSIDPQAQVRRVQRTPSIAGELLRVKVQTAGGRQTMPALTLRGFPTWILGINPNEVKEDPQDPEKAERIRQMIIAYQVEAVDVLYRHFAQKTQARQIREVQGIYATVVPAEPLAEPTKPAEDAPDEEQATYYAHLAAWALWKAAMHNQQWRSGVQAHLESLQIQLESEKAVTDLIPEIVARLGPPTITAEQQGNIRGMVKRLSELSGIHSNTIHWELSQAFKVAKYQQIQESQYEAVCDWFNKRIEVAKKRRGKS